MTKRDTTKPTEAFYVASVMGRKKNIYRHTVLTKWARSRKAAKNWFDRQAEKVYPSTEGWYVTVHVAYTEIWRYIDGED